MIGYDDWMRRTAVLASRRSSQLIRVDEALQAFSRPGGSTPVNLSAVKKAFEAWKLSKGVDWRKSDRNRNKACEQLEAELHGQGKGRVLSAAEIAAIKEVERANAMNLDRMFRSRQLQWKSVTKSTDVSATRSSLLEFKKISGGVQAAVGPGGSGGGLSALSRVRWRLRRLAVENFLKTLFDELDLSSVIASLGFDHPRHRRGGDPLCRDGGRSDQSSGRLGHGRKARLPAQRARRPGGSASLPAIPPPPSTLSCV